MTRASGETARIKFFPAGRFAAISQKRQAAFPLRAGRPARFSGATYAILQPAHKRSTSSLSPGVKRFLDHVQLLRGVHPEAFPEVVGALDADALSETFQ